jgi:hypothetical protein
MKWYHWVIVAVLGLWVYRRFRGAPAQPSIAEAAAGDAPPTADAPPPVHVSFDTPIRSTRLTPNGALMAVDLRDAWGGVDAQVRDLRPVDDPHYPGWYRTGDGGWYRPETGESYSPGSSPPAIALPDASAFIEIDVSRMVPPDQQTAATYMIR